MAAGDDIAADLVAEQRALDEVVAPLDAPAGRPDAEPGLDGVRPDRTPHLLRHHRALALRDTDAFVAHRNELIAKFADPAAVEYETLGRFRTMAPAELLAEWRSHRDDLADAASGVAPDARIEWYGPSMSLRSFLTARLMEVWAHGQDIVDAVGAERPATDRVRHIAQLGVITRGWSYRNRGREAPADEVRVVLTAPSGAEWTWGDEAAAATVSGPALDFCLVVTQRRHVDDTALVTSGHAAREWMEIAQAFAGPPTDGPARLPGGSA
jgi:uncharacterized protein (TIGR03084 family)